MARSNSERGSLATGLAFIAPNIVGVLTFVVFPVVFAIVLAFTNWDLRKHNMFKDELPHFVGLDNFIRLITEADFTKYLGNTLFLMMGIPAGISAALVAALLLSRDTRAGGGRTYHWLLITGLMAVSTMMLVAAGAVGTAAAVFFTGLACLVLIGGMTGGVTIYRTLFYTPHFTSGVATFILWKKLYNPASGPINQGLAPVLESLTAAVNWLPAALVVAFSFLCLGLMALLLWSTVRRLWSMWNDGDLGARAALIGGVFLLPPIVVSQLWSYTAGQVGSLAMVALAAVILAVYLGRAFTKPADFPAAPMNGTGSGLVLCLASMVGMFVLLGFSAVFANLPAMAATSDGLTPPEWLTQYSWAKPALMIMGFWGAMGSNTMLLYLAALTNVPQELYEAADIDGASRFQKFWNVTWPQLAPTTFFVAVMATIGGLQGGFEAARVMTEGGPSGATTTLSYFIYIEGFQTGRLSFSAGVAWALFILVFTATMFNWKFGNKYVND